MNREKYPDYFLVTAVLYIIILLAGFSYFFVPAFTFGFGYFEFYVIGILLFLPLILFALYANVSRFTFLWGSEGAIRTAITAITIVDFLMVLYFMFLMI